jgi:5-methyltetrahydrofolate--homocysteine methyltransferase
MLIFNPLSSWYFLFFYSVIMLKKSDLFNELTQLMTHRILVLDGAMGTMIAQYKLQENDFRPTSLKQHPIDLNGNNEMLNITRPDVIEDIHTRYFLAGADIVETNTFGANSVAQADYRTQHLAKEQNIAAVEIAKKARQKAQQSLTNKPLFIAGALGPTPKTASISPDVNDPASRNVDFKTLEDSYFEQVDALMEAGVDLILIETIFDTLNAKAAIFATQRCFESRNLELPIMISGTVTDASGRILSGQTVEAFLRSVEHANPITIGLNCALGAALMRPYVEDLAKKSTTFICVYPNAGLPNPMSETGFDETPDITSGLLRDFAKAGLVNIVGGCCGTTPEHIQAIAQAVKTLPPREISS